jgi:hypothetical protein
LCLIHRDLIVPFVPRHRSHPTIRVLGPLTGQPDPEHHGHGSLHLREDIAAPSSHIGFLPDSSSTNSGMVVVPRAETQLVLDKLTVGV